MKLVTAKVAVQLKGTAFPVRQWMVCWGPSEFGWLTARAQRTAIVVSVPPALPSRLPSTVCERFAPRGETDLERRAAVRAPHYLRHQRSAIGATH